MVISRPVHIITYILFVMAPRPYPSMMPTSKMPRPQVRPITEHPVCIHGNARVNNKLLKEPTDHRKFLVDGERTVEGKHRLA